MRSIKNQFYHLGVDNQKRSDITIDLRRVDTKNIDKWTEDQKISAISWIKYCQQSFDTFISELNKSLKTPTNEL